MGTNKRPRPEKLAEKLFQIRESFGLSQDEIIVRLGLDENVSRSNVSQYERGIREPSYLTLLAYSKIAGVCSDILIDDYNKKNGNGLKKETVASILNTE
ncbi:MAG: helix-turn-helix domain-containing protein [Acidobacteriota bacterium]|jgi:transcriptional regulator with XRE-family HTH domain|nr:helix-turn-helix domain-containing protein [Acidobacteriota bacterium]